MIEKRDENKKLPRIAIALIITVAIVTVIGWSWYFLSIEKSIRGLEKKLAKTAAKRSDKINEYIQKQVEHGYKRAEQTELINAMQKLAPLSEQELRAQSLSSYRAKISLFLEEFSTPDSYRNSLLINKDGKVVFSDYATQYVGKNLMSDQIKNSELVQSFQRVIMSLTDDVSEFSFDPILQRTVLFACIPVFKEGRLLGVLAQEINTAKIYAIVRNYIGLGSTGDVLLGKRVPEGILYISQSRNGDIKPFKHYIYYNRFHEIIISLPIARASTGHKGTGIYPDHTRNKAVSGWQFVPIANWGIVAKIDLFEIQEQFCLWFWINIILLSFLILLLIIIAYTFALFASFTQLLESWMHNHKKRLSLKFFLVFITTILCLVMFILYYRESGNELALERERASVKVEDAKNGLTHMLEEYERVGQSIVYDLDEGRLKNEDIVARLKRDLQEKTTIFGITVAYVPYKYDKNRRLYAPFVFRKNANLEIDYLDESFDYTKEEPKPANSGASNWSWYRQPLSEGKIVWFDPYVDPLTGLLLAGYSIPFYATDDTKKTEPIGVVNVVFDTAPIYNLFARLDVDTKGVTYLISRSGAFIYYPVKEYVAQQKTIYDVAREQGNERLINIAQRALKNDVGQDYFYDTTTQEKNYTYFQSEPISHWAIGIILPSSEVQLSNAELRHHYMLLIFVVLLLLLSLLWLIGGFIHNSLTFYARTSTIILIIALGALYYMLDKTLTFEKKNEVIITNPIQLNQFLYELDNYAKQVNEKPSLKIPFGIYLYSANLINYSTISISAYIWLKFPKDVDESLIKAPQLPQSISHYSQERKIYDVVEGEKRVVGWLITTDLTQSFNYSKYPLDVMNINIDVEYPDLSKNITLIPSLDDYDTITPEKLPGVGSFQGVVFPEFTKQRSFFALEVENEDCTMGLESYSNITKHIYLSYNLALTRHLLYDFITLLLPMLIIFFSIFTIFSMSERDIKIEPLTALSAYTGLVFTAIILHGTFRARQATSQLLYMEYIFFMLYITFVILVLHALLKMNEQRINPYISKFFSLFRIFFWPVQLFFLLVLTMGVFWSS